MPDPERAGAAVSDAELVPVRKFRKAIPERHRASLDTRVRWLWHQRFGTIQMIYTTSTDILDHTACTLIIQAIYAKDLTSLEHLLQRLEGGALTDEELLDQGSMPI